MESQSTLMLKMMSKVWMVHRPLSVCAELQDIPPPPVQQYRTARSQVQPLSCRYFTYRELEIASQNWSAACIIGDGGFGRVYKGTLSSGRQIAIKRLDRHGLQV